jgi:hypothetical protein
LTPGGIGDIGEAEQLTDLRFRVVQPETVDR